MATPTLDERIEKHRGESAEEARRNPSLYVNGYPNMLVDEEGRCVVMTRSDVARLSEYNATVPTGVYVDKCWLWRRPEYGDRLDDGVQLVLRVYRETDPPSLEMRCVGYEILLVDD